MIVPPRSTVQKYFASGPCLICGGPTYNAAHRVVDSIRGQFQAGDSITSIARDFEIPRVVIEYIAKVPIRQLDWLRRYRGKDAAKRMEKAVSGMKVSA